MTLKSAFALALAGLAALSLSSCGDTPKPLGGAPGLQVAQLSDLPKPGAEDRITVNEPYVLGPLDKIDIEVYGVPDLKRTITIDNNGTFDFPLAGQVQASGLTPSQLSAALASQLTKYIKDPQVTINIAERVSQSLTIDGQVVRPGQYAIPGRQTLMRAIAVAGGTAEYAKLDDVVVFRTVQGQRYVGIYNLAAIRRGNYPDPELFANDIVIVGESAARRRFEDILQTLPVLTAPLILLLQNL